MLAMVSTTTATIQYLRSRRFTRADPAIAFGPRSIAIDLSLPQRAVFNVDGRQLEFGSPEPRIVISGIEPVSMIEIERAGEGVSIALHEQDLADMADQMRVSKSAMDASLITGPDPVMWAIAVHLRSALLAQVGLTSLARDRLVHLLFHHLLARFHNGKPRERGDGGLERRRAGRLVDHIDANLTGEMTIAELASVAALSPFHFLRSFKASFGMTPHKYVTARRMDRARRDLAAGDTVATVARRYGIVERRHFEDLYLRHFGRAADVEFPKLP